MGCRNICNWPKWMRVREGKKMQLGCSCQEEDAVSRRRDLAFDQTMDCLRANNRARGRIPACPDSCEGAGEGARRDLQCLSINQRRIVACPTFFDSPFSLLLPCRVVVGRGRADDALLGGGEHVDRLSGGEDGDGRAERTHPRVVLPRLRGRGTVSSRL